MTLIDKETIRAEIKRRKDKYDKMLHEWSIAEVRGRKEEAKELLSFLDTLPEQPVEELEDDKIINYAHSKFYYDKDFDGYGHSKFRPVLTREDLISFAHHFAEWGAKHLKK